MTEPQTTTPTSESTPSTTPAAMPSPSVSDVTVDASESVSSSEHVSEDASLKLTTILASAETGDFIALSERSFPVGQPLRMLVVDREGALLLDDATVLPKAEDRALLFRYFVPRGLPLPEEEVGAGNGEAQAAAPGNEAAVAADKRAEERVRGARAANVAVPSTSMAMHLPIGTRIGVRLPGLSKRTSYASRLIGIAPNDALFVTPPAIGNQRLEVKPGESVEVIAVSSRTVFVFNSTVEAVCLRPFAYCILSQPGLVRRVRQRRTARVQTKLAVLYQRIDQLGEPERVEAFDGLGIAFDLSILGMSLSATAGLGKSGTRVRLVFHLISDGQTARIDTHGIIRSISTDARVKSAAVDARDGTPLRNGADFDTVEPIDALLRHGVEFDSLSVTDKLALRSYVLEQAFAL